MRDYIINKVNKLKQKYKTSDPFELIEAMGINLKIDYNLTKLKGFYYVTHHQRYIIINGNLDDREQSLVAAHELGHDTLHRNIVKVSPLKDFQLYDMASLSEYEANLFASELLIEDSLIKECISEEMDYFCMCKTIRFRPEIVTFKLYNMMQKGYPINLPENISSKFLGK